MFTYSNDVAAWTSKRSKKDERIPCSTMDKSLSEHHISNEGPISCMLTKNRACPPSITGSYRRLIDEILFNFENL